MDEISTQELLQRLDDPELKIIDIRSVDAYNGWKMQKEARGGHIKGAKSLPSKWLRYIEWIEIVRNKGILPEEKLIIYGYDSESVNQVAAMFARAGYSDVSIYHNFTSEWCTEADLPMEALPRYQHLVPAEWLHSLITTGSAPEYTNDKFVLFHGHYQNPSDYEQGHIPGAIEVDTNTLESTETWNRRKPEELKAAFESMGITHDTTVILYGRFSAPDNNDMFPGSSAGHLGAIRCAFIMLYAGIKDVRVLNGGVQSWLDAGFETTTEKTDKKPVSDFGASVPGRPELAVDTPEAKEILSSDDKNLVSVRSWDEYIGRVSGYNYIKKKGRIPGSVFADCGSDAYHMENYRNLDHTIREYNEIKETWANAGITSEKHNAFYCGTGWRGSEAFLSAWLMGWPRVSVYDGGWYEWSSDETNPIETGNPEMQYCRGGNA